MPIDWVAIYHDYLLELRKENQAARKFDGFHMSMIGSCQRKSIYERSGIVLTPDIGRLRRFRQGTVIHDDYQTAWLGSRLAQEAEVLVELELTDYLPEGWAGTADAVFYSPADEEITDVKTVNAAAFRYAIEFPKHADCLQLGGYWTAAEKRIGRPIAKGSIIYVPLGAFEEPIVARVDPDYKDQALRAMVALEEAWERYTLAEELPARATRTQEERLAAKLGVQPGLL